MGLKDLASQKQSSQLSRTTAFAWVWVLWHCGPAGHAGG